jgi:hypothetical protein
MLLAVELKGVMTATQVRSLAYARDDSVKEQRFILLLRPHVRTERCVRSRAPVFRGGLSADARGTLQSRFALVNSIQISTV